jgi:molybdate transport system regulatory protein
MSKDVPTIRISLWLETAEGLYFGLGRAMLLSKIQQHGSLRKAAEELGMSYRAAWGKIKKTEEILGLKLIDQIGSKREGYQLTESGKVLMESFLLWFDEVEREALRKAREILPVSVRSFKETRGQGRGQG